MKKEIDPFIAGKINELLLSLDAVARRYDSCEYGLPLTMPEPVDALRVEVGKFLDAVGRVTISAEQMRNREKLVVKAEHDRIRGILRARIDSAHLLVLLFNDIER